MNPRRYTVLHLFAGIGGGALGFKAARARLGALDGIFENIGGVDCDEQAIEDYTRLTGTQGTVLDLFTAEDYEAFHGKPPPADWREATPSDIAAATGGEAPDVVFLSPPCKSFSGLLPKRSAKTAKYQALSRLVVRGLWLTLEAHQQRPKLIILENVPRIQQRGRALLDRNIAMLQHYGYAVQETTHDCGEIGGLAAHRKRFLLVARHVGQVAPFLYEPPKKPMRTLGDEILRLPLPFDPGAGPMHHLPKLQWKTWLRLALVPAGGDWRDLQTWAPGTFDVERTPFNNVYRVLRTDEPAPTVTGGATPTAGGYSVADPRLTDRPGRHTSKLHIGELDQPARTVTGARVGSGTISVSDPRLTPSSARHTTKFYVADPARPGRTVTGTMDVQAGAMSTVDPRMSLPDKSVTLRMRRLDTPAATVVGRSSVWDSGGQSIPDPRPVAKYRNGTLGVGRLDAPAQTVVAAADIWTVGSSSTPDPRVTTEYYRGTYGVRRLDQPASTVTGNARESTGAFSVPDVRVGKAFEGTYGVADPGVPSATVTGKAQATTGRFSVPDARLVDGRPEFWPDWVPIIISPHDGCMHRPLTTLELYALQGFDASSAPKLAGRSVARWRTAIGNAVPPPAAQAVAETMLMTLLANEQSQQPLPATPVWVAELPLLNRVLRVLAPDAYPSEAPA